MTITITPLHACITQHAGSLTKQNFMGATEYQLNNLLLTAGGMLATKPTKFDLARALIWFVCAEFSRRGIAPRYRNGLGHPVYRATTPIEAAVKRDAPYLDLQWLAFQYPQQPIPRRWENLMRLPRNLVPTGVPERKYRNWDIDPFGALERIVGRRAHVGVKCRLLRLTHEQQVGMRYYCTHKVADLIHDTDVEAPIIERRIERQRIPQLRLKWDWVANRVKYWKAWRLAGGGNNWAGSARIFGFMTGRAVTRQAVRGMIGTMKMQKIARRRQRKRVVKAVL